MSDDARAIGILGRKVGMTRIFDESGKSVPVTVLEAGPCDVLQIRTLDRDGYAAVQLGYLNKPRRLATRAARGQVAKLDSKRGVLSRDIAAIDLRLFDRITVRLSAAESAKSQGATPQVDLPTASTKVAPADGKT